MLKKAKIVALPCNQGTMMLSLKRLFLPLFLLSTVTLQAASPLLFHEPKAHIEVNNRVLATVAGAPITTVDLMKAMDLSFYRQYPEYASSNGARHQYYLTTWKATLKDLIDKQLVLADAADTKLDVGSKEIRQEIEEQFGPNIIANLHKAGLTYDETWDMIKTDMMLRRMMIFRVQGKAMRAVTPAMIRRSYEESKDDYRDIGEWTYRILAIRDKSESKSKTVAENLASRLPETTIDKVEALIDTQQALSPSTTVKLSEEMKQNERDVSPAYREVLDTLYPGSYSAPVRQEGRGGAAFYRIFYLASNKAGGFLPFSEVTPGIKNKLISKQMDIEMEAYLGKLRKRYGINVKKIEDSIKDYLPFDLHVER